jgi:hypothetical protein
MFFVLHSFQKIHAKMNNQFHPNSESSVHFILNIHNVRKTFDIVKTEGMDGNEMNIEQNKIQMIFECEHEVK